MLSICKGGQPPAESEPCRRLLLLLLLPLGFFIVTFFIIHPQSCPPLLQYWTILDELRLELAEVLLSLRQAILQIALQLH